jgi:CheY-like chemotaxis protein
MNASPKQIAYVSRMAKLTAEQLSQEPPASLETGPTLPRQPAHILVVESDPKSRLALCRQLKRLGLQPRAVADSLTALNVITCQPPELILLCCNGRGVAYYDVALRSAVVSRAREQRIPIFVLSSEVDDNLWTYCLQRDIDCVLEKPLGAADLQTLRIWLDLPLPPSKLPPASRPSADNVEQWCKDQLAQDIEGFEKALAKRKELSMIRFAHRLNGATHILQAHAAGRLAHRLEQAVRGEISLAPETIQSTLAALKEAIAQHFA